MRNPASFGKKQQQTEEFLSLKAGVCPNQAAELAQEREAIHPEATLHALEHLKTYYKGKFDYQQFKTAKTETADSLYEAERELSIHPGIKSGWIFEGRILFPFGFYCPEY